jgi:gamma-glutamyltranspeptidase/glutathione hydrolase
VSACARREHALASRNAVVPRERPHHNIVPGFLTRYGAPVMSFDVAATTQPQSRLQLVVGIADYG